METDQLIATETFCQFYQVEYNFVQSMQEMGLIQTVIVSEKQFLLIPHLKKIERIIRLHDDLDINLEGIEAIQNLLDKIDVMNNEMAALRNKLRFYEVN